MTSGGYGYTVGSSIAYAYLPVEHDVGTEVAVEIFGEWVAGVVAASPSTTLEASGSAGDRSARGGVERVWPGGVASGEVLGGGITNHNVKVTGPDGVVVLRVAGKETDLLGIDRAVEHAATRAAAALGVGPQVVRSSSPRAGW